jgi:hypothetical protein
MPDYTPVRIGRSSVKFFFNIKGGGLGSHRNWLSGLDSPLIKDDGGQKEIKLRFDVSQYSPEEIMVKTVDNKLLVSSRNGIVSN